MYMMEMTRASATPARGSASLPGSERATPTYAVAGLMQRGPMFNSSNSLRASDFGAKIKQLEELGSRLRGEVDGILKEKEFRWREDNSSSMSPPDLRYQLHERQNQYEESDGNSIRELTDITNEQRTIEAMKSKLDEHSLHAESLHNRVRAASPMRNTTSYVLPNFPPDARRLDMMLPPSILERELRECRQQNEYLKSQLETTHHQHSSDTQEARHTIEELKARLYELQTRNDSVERAQEEERQAHSSLVSNLQESLHQLQTANRDQEQTLLQTNQKVDVAQQNFYILESALSQLRGILLNSEQRRGRPFFDNDPVQGQSATMLVHCVERCIQEHMAENEMRISKLRQVETSMEENRKMHESRHRDLQVQFQERLNSVTQERDQKLHELREMETESRRRAENLENQVRELSETNRSQNSEYSTRLTNMKDEMERQTHSWGERIKALENALDSSQRETAAAISRKDQTMRELAETESSLQASTVQRAELKGALEEEQSRRRQSMEQITRLERQVAALSQKVEEKRMNIRKMEDTLERSRHESAMEMTRIKQAEKEAGDRLREELQMKLYAMSEEFEASKREVCETRAAVEQLQSSLTDAQEQYNMCKIELEGLADEKGHLQSIIGNRSAEVERLTSERDYFFRCLDEKTEEVSYLKAEKQRLITQLEDRLTDLKVLDEERTKQSGNYYNERESLQVRFAEKERELEAMRSARDSLLRRLKAKEKHVKEMENSRDHDCNELKSRRMELEAVYRERNQLYLELKESRQEALNLTNETEEMRRAAHERESDLERKLHDVTARLEELESRPCKEGRVNGVTARRPIGRIQKEVTMSKNQMTSLQVKLKEVEEKTVTLEEERRKLKEENIRLVRLMERLTLQNETLSKELEFYLGKNQDMLAKVAHYETTADEAMQRNHILQRQIDTLESENAALRYKLMTVPTGDNPSADLNRARQCSTEKEVQQLGQNLRTTLGDVRTLLAEHSLPNSGGDSQVGELLIERDL